jgi:hypothetical protein
VGPAEKIDDEALKLYVSLFKWPLAVKSIMAMRAVTQLANDQMVKMAATMAIEELAS